jgi:hypothetical protein
MGPAPLPDLQSFSARGGWHSRGCDIGVTWLSLGSGNGDRRFAPRLRAASLILACSLFGVARYSYGALLFPDTLLWVTIFGVCQGGKEYLDKHRKSLRGVMQKPKACGPAKQHGQP